MTMNANHLTPSAAPASAAAAVRVMTTNLLALAARR